MLMAPNGNISLVHKALLYTVTLDQELQDFQTKPVICLEPFHIGKSTSYFLKSPNLSISELASNQILLAYFYHLQPLRKNHFISIHPVNVREFHLFFSNFILLAYLHHLQPLRKNHFILIHPVVESQVSSKTHHQMAPV